ncbi:Predicted periplasmic or secreted lipoprotein [Candidatus Terasakiella magnetica]|nr:Predicted periplasmic or secreted lipoprotein [Candidatus Terasakiella magnetica]
MAKKLHLTKISSLPVALCAALLLAGCAAEPAAVSAPKASAVTMDDQGRVVRARGDRNRDDSIGRAVVNRLVETDKEAFKGVSVKAWDGTVLLTGAVSKPEYRRRAVQLAKVAEDVLVVHDELSLSENPASPDFVPDSNREQRIYAGLLGQDKLAGAYVVRVVGGVAYLLGTARSAEDVTRAIAFVREAEGVKWVVDRVSVR